MKAFMKRMVVGHGETGGRYTFKGFESVPCTILEDRGEGFFGSRYTVRLSDGREVAAGENDLEFQEV